jgi:hypothetical protein
LLSSISCRGISFSLGAGVPDLDRADRVGIYIRARIAETLVFSEVARQRAPIRLPVVEAIRRHPRSFFVVIGARMAENGLGYLFPVFGLSYIVGTLRGSHDGRSGGKVLARDPTCRLHCSKRVNRPIGLRRPTPLIGDLSVRPSTAPTRWRSRLGARTAKAGEVFAKPLRRYQFPEARLACCASAAPGAVIIDRRGLEFSLQRISLRRRVMAQ